MKREHDEREKNIVSNNKGTNIVGVRDYNERLILQLIRKNGSVTKAETSRATGLSPNAVSVIFRSLEKDGLVLRGEPIRGRVGQPSVPMSLNPNAAHYLGLKVGRRSVEMIAMNYVGDVLGRVYRSHSYPLPDDTIAFVRQAIPDVLKQARLTRKAITAMGVAIPYELWSWTAEFDAPWNDMQEWKSFDLHLALTRAVSWPVFVENDGAAACGAELTFGADQSRREFIYLFVGTIIGGGIALNGSVFTGRSGNAAGFGPMPIPGPGGRSERLVDHASLVILERMIARAGGDGRAIYTDDDIWHEYAEEVSRWTGLTARGLAHAIVATLSIIDLESVVVDGCFPRFVRDSLIESIASELHELDLQGIHYPEMTTGSFGSIARTIGAACIPLNRDHSINQSTLLQG